MRKFMLMFILIFACLSIVACGRYGPLEPPASADDAANQQKPSDGLEGVARKRSKSKQPIEVPKQEFFLDPLL